MRWLLIFFYITNWLNENSAEVLISHLDMTGLFLIQFNSYSKHFEELVKHFYPDKKDMPHDRLNIQELIKEHLPDITKRYHKEDKIMLLPPLDYKLATTIKTIEKLNCTTIPQEKRNITKPKRKILITNEQAEKELLLKIFKVQ